MKPKSFLKRYVALAAMALLCCGALLINSNARAQCPGSDGPAPDPTIPGNEWYSYVTSQQIPGTNCWIDISYCSRLLSDGTIQVWIYEVDPQVSVDCNGITGDVLIHDARDLVTKDIGVTHNVTAVCIKYENQVINVFTPQCWSRHDGQFTTTITQCSGSQYWCEKICDICYYGNGTYTLSNCSYEVSEASSGCSILPISGQWLDDVCYAVPCDES
jgi:hypothetical protein